MALNDYTILTAIDQPSTKGHAVTRFELNVFVVEIIIRGTVEQRRLEWLNHHIGNHVAEHGLTPCL